jgi:hypothetical protein
VEVLEIMFMSSPHETMLEMADSSSDTTSSNLTITESSLWEFVFSVLCTSPLLLLFRVEDELEVAGLSLEVT